MRIGIGLLAVVAAWGCASVQEHKTADVEQLLSAAGFEARQATTEEQQAHLASLQQHQVVMHSKDGKPYYVFADAADCKCIYVGNEKAYQEYQRLAEREKIAEEQREAAEAREDAAMDWGIWGPW